jgi:hypothetical protein
MKQPSLPFIEVMSLVNDIAGQLQEQHPDLFSKAHRLYPFRSLTPRISSSCPIIPQYVAHPSVRSRTSHFSSVLSPLTATSQVKDKLPNGWGCRHKRSDLLVATEDDGCKDKRAKFHTKVILLFLGCVGWRLDLFRVIWLLSCCFSFFFVGCGAFPRRNEISESHAQLSRGHANQFIVPCSLCFFRPLVPPSRLSLSLRVPARLPTLRSYQPYPPFSPQAVNANKTLSTAADLLSLSTPLASPVQAVSNTS